MLTGWNIVHSRFTVLETLKDTFKCEKEFSAVKLVYFG
jgi:hypothetical protein